MAQDEATEIFPSSFFTEANECAVEAWLDFLGHRWNALILYHLSETNLRFGGIRELLPKMTPKVLTERLNELQRVGLVERDDATLLYGLTEFGISLMPILHGLEVWSRGRPDPRDRYR